MATLRGERGFGWVEALAIRGGRVVAAGRAAEVESLAGPQTEMWRLADSQLVMPSITDAHLHLVSAARSAAQPDLTGLDLDRTAAMIATAHEQLVRSGDREGWLLGHGWSLDALGRRPTAAALDAVAPGRPVALWAHDHHARWLSSEALRRAGTEGRPEPTAGWIERDAEGRASGVLLEAAAGLVEDAIPEARPEDVQRAIIAYARQLARLGITSVHDPGDLTPDPELHGGASLLRAMSQAGRLPLRVTASIREEQLERAVEMGFQSGRPAGPAHDRRPQTPAGSGADDDRHDADRYRDGWLKLFADGALGSRTAALLEPYEGDDPAGPPPGAAAGMTLRSEAELTRMTSRAAAAGIASQIHAIGDAAVRTALDVIAGLPAVAGFVHRVEHAQLVHPADVARFGRLGIAASVQPCHLISDAAAMRTAWGARIAHAFPLADLERNGALLPFGTDAPVEAPDPWPGIAAAVARRGPGWPTSESVHPEQSVGLGRALRAACLDGPRSAGRGDEGHLDSGARADLIVVPADPVREPAGPDQLATVRPLATLLDGSVIHRDRTFDP